MIGKIIYGAHEIPIADEKLLHGALIKIEAAANSGRIQWVEIVSDPHRVSHKLLIQPGVPIYVRHGTTN